MNLTRTLNTWRAERRTVRELNRLTDRGLEDLGMNRADIEAIARRSVR